MTSEITKVAIRNNAFKEGGIFVGNSILTDSRLTPLEKLLYAHINVLNSYGHGCYQSCEYIAAKIGGNAGSIKRCIYKLVKLGLLKRVEKGENGVRRHLICCTFVSDETIQNYKLDQNDPAENQIVPPEDQIVPTPGHKLYPERAQIVPDRILLEESIEYNNKYQEQIVPSKEANRSTSLHSLSRTAEAEDVTPRESANQLKAPSKKVPAKKVSPLKSPRPGGGCTVMMTDGEWQDFVATVGQMCALYLCDQFEAYKKKHQYSDHYRTLLNWNQRELGKRRVFGFKKNGGWGYYDQYTKDLVFEGDK